MPGSIDEDALKRELLAFHATGRKQPPNDALAQILLDICWTVPGHWGDEWREDCVSYAAGHLTTVVVYRWEPGKGSPFDYFHTAARYAVIKEYRKMQKQRRACVAAFHLYDGENPEEVTAWDCMEETMHHLKKQNQRERDVRKWGDRAVEMRAGIEAKKEREEKAERERKEQKRKAAVAREEPVRTRAEERRAKAKAREERLAEGVRLRREERQRNREEKDRREQQERQRLRDEKRAKREREEAERKNIPHCARKKLCRLLRFVVGVKQDGRLVYPHRKCSNKRGKECIMVGTVREIASARRKYGVRRYSDVRLVGE